MHFLRQTPEMEEPKLWRTLLFWIGGIAVMWWAIDVFVAPKPTDLDCMNLLDRGIPCDILD